MHTNNERSKIIIDDNAFAILISTTAFFYPLISDFGASVDAPILVYVEDESAFQDFVESTGGKMHEIHTTGDVPKDIRRMFSNEKREVYFLRFLNSRYLTENLQQVKIASQSTGDDGVRPLIFIVATRPVQEKYFRYFAGNLFWKIDKTKNLSEYWIRKSEVVDAAISGQKVIRKRIRQISEHPEHPCSPSISVSFNLTDY